MWGAGGLLSTLLLTSPRRKKKNKKKQQSHAPASSAGSSIEDSASRLSSSVGRSPARCQGCAAQERHCVAVVFGVFLSYSERFVPRPDCNTFEAYLHRYLVDMRLEDFWGGGKQRF